MREDLLRSEKQALAGEGELRRGESLAGGGARQREGEEEERVSVRTADREKIEKSHLRFCDFWRSRFFENRSHEIAAAKGMD